MNNFFKIKKASNDITTYLKRNQISIDSDVLKQLIKDNNATDYSIWFEPEGSYIKWQINISDNGIGQALVDVSVIELVIQGKLQYELEDGTQNEIDVTLPVNKNEIKTEINITNNILEVSYIDYHYHGNEINVVFGSVEE